MTDNTNLNEETEVINEAEEAVDVTEADGPEADVAVTENTAEEVVKASEKKDSEASAGYLFRLVGTLAAICVAIAVLLAVVNAVTREKIAENVTASKKEAILDIFEKGNDCELYKTLEDGTEIYLVCRDNGLIGYCAFVSSTGFGGNIDMMVGIDSAYVTEGVKIVSMSETPGVGTKTDSADFLECFKGAPHSDPVGAVDAISGATISSDAVKAGVLAAHAVEIDLNAICAEKDLVLITPDMLEDVTDEVTSVEPSAPSETSDVTDPAETDPAETDPVSPDTDETQTDPPETEDIPFVDNPGSPNFNYNVDASTGSDRFVIEIPKDDETATFETTTEPETTPEPIVTEPVVTLPPVTEPVVTTPPVTEPIVTEPPVTEAPTTEAVTTEDPNEIPPWLDTQEEETMPPWLDTQEEETMPSWIGG